LSKNINRIVLIFLTIPQYSLDNWNAN